jgi:hypothetical protein
MSCSYVIDIFENDNFSRCHMSGVNLICLSEMNIFLNLDVKSIFKHSYLLLCYISMTFQHI